MHKTAKKENRLPGTACFLAILIFFAIKFFGPIFIQSLYNAGHIDFLNRTTSSNAPQNLEYYQGRAEEKLLGPIQFLISGLLFAAFAHFRLRDTSTLKFGFAVFLFLLITKCEILFYPPYGGDAITGPFAEAIWLANNSFNYPNLAQQPGYTAGGPRVYLFSLYPGFLALQMILIPSKKIFLFLNHLIVFAMAATVIALFRNMAAKIFDKTLAPLLAVLILAFPLFQSQIEMINMEMPTLFFTALSAYYLAEKKLLRACAAAIVAAGVKGSGVIACGAVFLTCWLLFFFSQRHKYKGTTLIAGMLAVLWALLISAVTRQIATPETSVTFVRIFTGSLWNSIRDDRFLDIILVTLCVLSIELVIFGFRSIKARQNPLASFASKRHYVIITVLTYAIMWYALFIHFTTWNPRYRLLLLPFLLFCFFYLLDVVILSIRFKRCVLFLAAGLMFFSAYGLLEAPAGHFQYIELERSLEYRSVLVRDQRLVKEIEKNFSHLTILAPSIVARILAMPQLGYATKPLDVVIYETTCSFGRLKNFSGLKNLDIARTLCIGLNDDTAINSSRFFPYPVEKKDKIIKRINYGNKEAVLFFGGRAIERMHWLTLRDKKIRLMIAPAQK